MSLLFVRFVFELCTLNVIVIAIINAKNDTVLIIDVFEKLLNKFETFGDAIDSGNDINTIKYKNANTENIITNREEYPKYSVTYPPGFE